MIEAPKHDWNAVEERSREDHIRWLRSLSPRDAMAILDDCHRLVTQLSKARSFDSDLQEMCWRDRVAIRKKVLSAFHELDRRWHERTNSAHAG